MGTDSYSVNSDQGGAYNILDIARYEGEGEFDEILKTISLRLKYYEDTGLTSEQIRELKERDTAMDAVITGDNHAIGCKVGVCPKCNAMIRSYMKFCFECGQRLWWRNYDGERTGKRSEGDRISDICS